MIYVKSMYFGKLKRIMSITVPTKNRKEGGLRWGRGVPGGKAHSRAQGFQGGRFAAGHKENPVSLSIYASVTGDLEQTYFFFFKCFGLLTGKM